LGLGRDNGLVTFKSVCMGQTYLDRAGTFYCVPRGRRIMSRPNQNR
jgi:hypothetical protein